MERNQIINNSCKIIQRELKRLNKLGCTVELHYDTLTCFDNSISAEKVKRSIDGDDLDFKNQVVYEFSQHLIQ